MMKRTRNIAVMTRRNSTRALLRSAALPALLCTIPQAGWAQLTTSDLLTYSAADFRQGERGPESVVLRSRPGFEPHGVRLGPFVVTPLLTTGVGFDDNMLMGASKARSDFVTRIAPVVRIRSYTGRVSVSGEAGVEQVLFARTGELDGLNARAIGNSRVQIDSNSHVWLSGAYVRQIDGGVLPVLETPDLLAPGVLSYDPTTTSLYRAAGGYGVTLNRLVASVAVSGQRRTFEQSSGVRTAFDPSQRDGDAMVVASRVGYRVTGGSVVFAQASYNNRSYRNALFDSSGYRVELGYATGLGGLVQGEVTAGYLQQDLSTGQERISAPSFGAGLRWFPTERLTLSAGLRRDIGEPSVAGQRPLLSTLATLQAEVEVLNNVVLTGRYMFSRTAFGAGEARYLNYVEAGPTWHVNSNLRVSALYRFSSGTASDDSGSFSRNVAMVRVRLGF